MEVLLGLSAGLVILGALIFCFRYFRCSVFLILLGLAADFGLGAITPPRVVTPGETFNGEVVTPPVLDTRRMPIQDIGRLVWLWGALDGCICLCRAASKLAEGRRARRAGLP